MVAPVLEAEAVQATVARLEEGDHRRQIVGAADAVGDIIAAARVGPAGVALLVARGELDDLRAPLRPAARAAADVVWEPDLVETPSHAPPPERHGAGDVGRDLRAGLPEALGVAGHDGDVDARRAAP